MLEAWEHAGIADWTDRRTGTRRTGTVPDIDRKEQRLATKESRAEAPRRRPSIRLRGPGQHPNAETHQPKPIRRY